MEGTWAASMVIVSSCSTVCLHTVCALLCWVCRAGELQLSTGCRWSLVHSQLLFHCKLSSGGIFLK